MFNFFFMCSSRIYTWICFAFEYHFLLVILVLSCRNGTREFFFIRCCKKGLVRTHRFGRFRVLAVLDVVIERGAIIVVPGSLVGFIGPFIFPLPPVRNVEMGRCYHGLLLVVRRRRLLVEAAVRLGRQRQDQDVLMAAGQRLHTPKLGPVIAQLQIFRVRRAFGGGRRGRGGDLHHVHDGGRVAGHGDGQRGLGGQRPVVTWAGRRGVVLVRDGVVDRHHRGGGQRGQALGQGEEVVRGFRLLGAAGAEDGGLRVGRGGGALRRGGGAAPHGPVRDELMRISCKIKKHL
jgi:hypothetical protein